MDNHNVKTTRNDKGQYCFECEERGRTYVKVGGRLKLIKEGDPNALHSGSTGLDIFF